MIKLVATDIDGTILKSDFTFNKEVIDCIKTLSEKGVKVVLISGRMNESTIPIHNQLALDTPIGSYQGALVKLGKETLYERCLDKKIARDVINWAKNENIHVNLYMDDVLYAEIDDDTIRRYTNERNVRFVCKNFDDLELNNVNKLLLIDFNNQERVTFAKDYLVNKYPDLHICKSTNYFCEVCNGEASKGDAVKFLQEYYGLKKDEILAIGDHNNDIPLLLAGGIKVAMGNGTPEIKAVADYVTGTVLENGFVQAMEKFVLDAKI
ncbi:HAD family phosphatase [bacterium]|nr:HAD family phosphatase [bacterium]